MMGMLKKVTRAAVIKPPKKYHWVNINFYLRDE